MHPPQFLPSHQLSNWPACNVEVACCRGIVLLPVRLLAERYGNCSFEVLISRLRCGQCGKPPAPVYLCAGHREHCGGAPADWAIELVPAPKP